MRRQTCQSRGEGLRVCVRERERVSDRERERERKREFYSVMELGEVRVRARYREGESLVRCVIVYHQC